MQLDLNGSIPAFFTITEGRVNDVNFLDEITFERGAYYVMDKGYLDYERWYKIHQAGAFFVTRARHNMSVRRLYSNVVRKETSILCDQIVVLSGKKTKWRYPDKMRRIKYRDTVSEGPPFGDTFDELKLKGEEGERVALFTIAEVQEMMDFFPSHRKLLEQVGVLKK